MADDADKKLEENAAAPKRVRGDAGEVEQHSLKDQIEFDRYQRSKKATKNGLGLKVTKLVSSGSI